MVRWREAHFPRAAPWHSAQGAPPPGRVLPADESLSRDAAYRLARGGTALLWRGDYPGAGRLLRELGSRAAREPSPAGSPPGSYAAHRAARARRAAARGALLVLLGEDLGLDLPGAPDVRRACAEAYGPVRGPMVVALSELLGVLGAHQWRRTGVVVPALGARIHPHYGVFPPTRGEYVRLVAEAPLPAATAGGARRIAFDLGTGTGVLAAVLARRGFGRVLATDVSPRALACARDTMGRLGLSARVRITGPALYPEGRADLVVCNPPWLPGDPRAPLDAGVHDPESRMLRGFLNGLDGHLRPGGEGWLILSDLAERLGLRAPGELRELIAAAGLRVAGRLRTRPGHPRSRRRADPLHAARAAEVVTLWRLAPDRPRGRAAGRRGSPARRRTGE
ncbi:class I SAM-dependent methyltransferase [Streptomyces hoynatensis]|uniref:Class I SAM-dependent methyltransferase n=1 Tax=Streptomyces hoynatensis TaxID=1141874 RepID=A0A3A9YSV7_9ACTN|nr:class I SAM-dependent methyltransferase [Streptomyces hoynatensis]RKN38377.1 class I SAM-dependent methyltransferase [Streptomyces hoynatensis]